MVVVTMKKNSSMNTMSGRDAVDNGGTSAFFFFLIVAIIHQF